THNFSNPVLSQATSYNKEGGFGANTQFDFLLNFEDNWTTTFQTSGSNIYHLRSKYNTLIDMDITKISQFTKEIYPVANGNYPHLVYSQTSNDEQDVWKNHRVYNNGLINNVSRIVPNPIYFYPFDECPECQNLHTFISFTGSLGGGGISDIKFKLPADSEPANIAINLPYEAVSDSLGDYLIPTIRDTIYTDWITIDSTAELQYLVNLNDTLRVQFKLQKLSDSSFISLPAPFDPGTGFSSQVFYLVNGTNDTYRFAMMNTDTMLNYSENHFFDPPLINDTTYAKSSYIVSNNVVNLNKNISLNKQFNLQCMPNPASEVLKVAVYSNPNTKAESVQLQIYDHQGKIVWQSNATENSTSIIPVSNFENGIYLVRANILTDNGLITETSKVLILR
ncbi:MAG: T9SS type A sorting domain-containing protein, partial [Melioribacteraceae bacterium]